MKISSNVKDDGNLVNEAELLGSGRNSEPAKSPEAPKLNEKRED